jgi:hypothetical protein
MSLTDAEKLAARQAKYFGRHGLGTDLEHL